MKKLNLNRVVLLTLLASVASSQASASFCLPKLGSLFGFRLSAPATPEELKEATKAKISKLLSKVESKSDKPTGIRTELKQFPDDVYRILETYQADIDRQTVTLILQVILDHTEKFGDLSRPALVRFCENVSAEESRHQHYHSEQRILADLSLLHARRLGISKAQQLIETLIITPHEGHEVISENLRKTVEDHFKKLDLIETKEVIAAYADVRQHFAPYSKEGHEAASVLQSLEIYDREALEHALEQARSFNDKLGIKEVIDRQSGVTETVIETPEERAIRVAAEEKQRLIDQQNRAEEQKRLAEERRIDEERRREEERLAEVKRIEQVQELTVAAAQPTRTGANLRDIIAYESLKKLSKAGRFNSAVMVAFGNAYENPTPTALNDYRQIVKQLIFNGKRIIYDADSLAAGVIAAEVGDSGFGITAHQDRAVAGKVLCIENPYMRKELFIGTTSKILTSPDSIIGKAIAINGKNVTVYDEKNQWADGFYRWKRDNKDGKEVGLSFSDDTVESKRYSSVDKIISILSGKGDSAAGKSGSLRSSGAKPAGMMAGLFNSKNAPELSRTDQKQEPAKIKPVDINIAHFIKPLSSSDIARIQNFVQDLIAKEDEVQGSANVDGPIPAGSLIIGSKLNFARDTHLIYEFTHRLASLGVTIADGGAMGYMVVASTAAYDAGAHSIGIPMGRGAVKGENHVARDKQTLTIVADGYEQRIPLLLQNRQLIGVAPGGQGTMSEIASALIDISSHPEKPTQIAFLGNRYYAGLAQFIQEGTRVLTDRIHVVNDARETDGVLKSLMAHPQFKRNEFMTAQRPAPRNLNTSWTGGYDDQIEKGDDSINQSRAQIKNRVTSN